MQCGAPLSFSVLNVRLWLATPNSFSSRVQERHHVNGTLERDLYQQDPQKQKYSLTYSLNVFHKLADQNWPSSRFKATFSSLMRPRTRPILNVLGLNSVDPPWRPLLLSYSKISPPKLFYPDSTALSSWDRHWKGLEKNGSRDFGTHSHAYYRRCTLHARLCASLECISNVLWAMSKMYGRTGVRKQANKGMCGSEDAKSNLLCKQQWLNRHGAELHFNCCSVLVGVESVRDTFAWNG